jgi:hypothetical protein
VRALFKHGRTFELWPTAGNQTDRIAACMTIDTKEAVFCHEWGLSLEAIDAIGRHINRGFASGDKISNQPPCGRSKGQAKMAMTKGKEGI